MPYSNVQWNFLTPYLTPLAGKLERSVPSALHHSRFNRQFAESNKRWGEGRPQRDASLEATQMRNVKSKEAQKAYQMSMYGNTGEVLDQPMDVDRLLKNEIARQFIGLPQQQRRGVVTSEGGQPVQKFVDPYSDQSYPVHQTPTPVPTMQGGKPGTLYTTPQQGQFFEGQPTQQQSGPEIGETQEIQVGTEIVTYQWDGLQWKQMARGPKWNPATGAGTDPKQQALKQAQAFVLKFATQSQNPMMAAMVAMNPENAANPVFQAMLRNEVPEQYQPAFDDAMAVITDFYRTQSAGIPSVPTADNFMKKWKLIPE